MTHRYSGWPGAWCLDCGQEDLYEVALAEDNYICVDDFSELGFHYSFPNVIDPPCPCPNTYGHDPYFQTSWLQLMDWFRINIYGLPRFMRYGDIF